MNDKLKAIPRKIKDSFIGSVKKRPKTWAASSTSAIIIAYLAWVFVFATVTILEQYEDLNEELLIKYPGINIRELEKVPNTIAYHTPDSDSKINEPSVDSVPFSRFGSYQVLLKADASAEDLAELLEKYDLSHNGGISKIGVVYLQKNKIDEKKYTLEDVLFDPTYLGLKKEEAVDTVVIDYTVTSNCIIPSNSTQGYDKDGNPLNWSWREVGSDNDGNWSHKITRLPAAWTIYKRKKNILSMQNIKPVKVGIIDSGFNLHNDLQMKLAPHKEWAEHGNHGNHVAGIIGATHNNGIGIDGVAIQVELYVNPIPKLLQNSVRELNRGNSRDVELVLGFNSDLVLSLVSMVDQQPDLSIINVSMGSNFRSLYYLLDSGFGNEISERKRKALLDIIKGSGRISRRILQLISTINEDVIVVSAAGNDSTETTPALAKYSNGLNFAALADPLALGEGDPINNVVVVEATDQTERRWTHSNVGGHVAAPGTRILSTIGVSSDAYEARSGTSMAAPFVSGLIALLKAYQPDMPPRKIADLIIQNAKPLGGESIGRVDALETILAVDEQALKYLADITEDGKVDNLDLQLMIEYSRQIMNSYNEFENDIDCDGQVTDHEDTWPIIDLNGSGVFSVDRSDRRLIKGKLMSDFDVMRAAWSDSSVNPPSRESFFQELSVPIEASSN